MFVASQFLILSILFTFLVFIPTLTAFQSISLPFVKTSHLTPKRSFSSSSSWLYAQAKPPTNNNKDTKTNSKDAVDTSQYWQGEWVCADCGYIYDREFDGGGLYFEQQPRGFICPQCSAPRKRYAKKVGDEWGVTRDGGDLPIYAFTFGGLAIVIWFSFFYVPSL